MDPFLITDSKVDPEILKNSLRDPQAGALVTFEGWVRDHNDGRSVDKLIYEAYDSLCIKEGTKIISEAEAKFDIISACCVHCTGDLAIGDLAVWIGVTAKHRGEAYSASKYIIDQIKIRIPIWKKEFYTNGTSEWVNCMQCHHHGLKHKFTNNTSAGEYYSTQKQLNEIGDTGQSMLSSKRVLIIGMGGLGCPVALNLATTGVGTIGMCDADRVSLSNLHRQHLYSIDDIGTEKVEVAINELRRRNPLINYRLHKLFAQQETISDLIADYDIILDCTDNLETKFLIHDECYKQKKDFISGAVYQLEGQLLVFNFSEGTDDKPCMRCLWNKIPSMACIGNCGGSGTLASTVSAIGAFQSMETVKLCLGLTSPIEGKLYTNDLSSYLTNVISIKKDSECPLCSNHSVGTYVSIDDFEVDSVELNDYAIIDLREDVETIDCAVAQKRNVTQHRYSSLDIDALVSEYSEEEDKAILLICSHGHRSKLVCEQLRDCGVNHVYSLKGGTVSL